MSIESYQLPVSRLLTYADCGAEQRAIWEDPEKQKAFDALLADPDKLAAKTQELKQQPPSRMADEWPNYVAELGLTAADIPELVRMVTDSDLLNLDEDDEATQLAIWAPVHAWRALGQLQAAAVIEPLLRLLEADDEDFWVTNEFATVMGLIGEAALAPLTAYLADAKKDDTHRFAAASSIAEIGIYHPDCRPQAIAILVNQLKRYARNPDNVNGILILGLVDLKAVEAADLIRRAFKSGRVDEMVPGPWPAVQVDLGLADAADFTEDELRPTPPAWAKKFASRHSPEELGLPRNWQAYEATLEDTRLDKFGHGALAMKKPVSDQPAKGFGGSAQPSGKTRKKKK